MKILLTGASGFVGARIAAAFPVIPSPSLRSLTRDGVRRMVDEAEPDVIIHTAAISDIATCEKNPDASWHANVELPLWLVGTGVKCVLFSSDQVYSGAPSDGHPYSEDNVCPANLYARHKLEMEQRSLDLSGETVLLRATWMYDMPICGLANRSNFLMTMLRAGEAAFSGTQHRAVTYVREVALHVCRAAQLPGGVYNYGSENSLTMLETAYWLKNQLQLPVVLHDAGPRHDLWMDCSKAAACGITFSSTTDGLRKCIADYSL